MKTFTEYKNKDQVVEEIQEPVKPQSVKMLESFTQTYSDLTKSIETAKEYIEEIRYLSGNSTEDYAKKEEVEQLFAAQLVLVSENLQSLKQELLDINEQDGQKLFTLISDIQSKSNSIQQYVQEELNKNKKDFTAFQFNTSKSLQLVNETLDELEEKTNQLSVLTEDIPLTRNDLIELRHDTTKNNQLVEELNAGITERLNRFHETLKENSSVIEILSQSYDTILTPAVNKINEFQTNIDTISGLATQYNETIEQTKQDIRAVVNEVNQIFINDKYLELDRKLQRVEEMFNAKVQLNEEQDKPDTPPISPVQQGFDPGQVSSLALKVKFLEQSIGRIVATGPGSGETRLRFLDDVDASTIGNNKYLRYNSTKNKFEFATLSGGGAPQVQSDWNETDNTEPSYILNKPTIPAAQIKSDWTETDTSLVSFILNKPTLFSGDYNDLTNQPSLFSGDYNDLTNQPSLFSGDYNDLTNQPTIPAALTDLSDVAIVTPSNGEVLKYNSSTGKWYNGTDNAGGGGGGGATDGYWGSFWSTQDQPSAGTTSANVVTLNNSDPDSNGVSVVSTSQITVANGGVYNFQFSFQFIKTNSSSDTIDIWIAKNGTPVSDTNSRITIQGNGQTELPAWNFVLSCDANDYIQFYWSSTDANMTLEHFATQSNPTRPAIPSAIVTVTAVAQVLNGLQVQSDWNQTSNTAVDYIKNKPSLFSGSYNDLTNKPTLFSGSYTDLTNKPSLFSGSYTDLTNKPSIPTVYDATVTIAAGTGMSGGGSFTLNQSGSTTITLNSTITQYTLPTASASTLGGVKVGTGLAIDGSGVLSASGSPSYTTVTTGDLIVTSQIVESFTSYSTSISSGGTATLDCSTGNIWNITSTVSGNWTAALTNVTLSSGQATNVTLIITQGATAYIPNALTVNSTSVTINWQGGSAPTGNASKKDIIAFSILQTGASTYLVFGQLVTFG